MPDGTVVLQCTCKHDFQDQIYGKGMRLHNVSQGGTGKDKVAYCTVCSPKQPKVKGVDPLRKPKNIKG